MPKALNIGSSFFLFKEMEKKDSKKPNSTPLGLRAHA